jgi:uncharacterized protein
MMTFEWDDAKDFANQKKHGVSFQRAARVFLDPLRVTKVERIEQDETRWQTFGVIEGIVLLMVAHTWLDIDSEVEIVRLISARRATRRERRIYENEDG